MKTEIAFEAIVESDAAAWVVRTSGAGPAGRLPLTAKMLLERPSGDIFGLTQNAGMGWDPSQLGRPQFLMLSTQGGIRAPDGLPFAGFCSDPGDGRTQGTTGMMDSLAYRNDAAIVLRRLARSLPTRKGVLGVATCDKGLPGMMMALAALRDLPCVLVPGGVTLPPTEGEDAGTVQSIGARFAHGELTLERAADLGCRGCGSPAGGGPIL